MDHGHHNHGDMGSQPMCSMNVSYLNTDQITPELSRLTPQKMLFTWDTTNLCIVFSSWRVTGPISLLFSIIAVMALTAGYEAVREASRAYENRLASRLDSLTRTYCPPLVVSGGKVEAYLAACPSCQCRRKLTPLARR